MDTEFKTRCIRLVVNLGLGSSKDIVSVEPLSGGVSSDIAVVNLGKQQFCAKFALPKLRVSADWYAPIGRNRAEYDWLNFAGQVVPGATPKLLGRDSELGGYVMEFIAPETAYVWKDALLERRPPEKEASAVGNALGQIHAASSRPSFNANRFQNQSNFYHLRLEPYLEFTARHHPQLAAKFSAIVSDLRAISRVLIHGDVSPKNILFREGNCVFLDAETATMGDPCFDIAFCANHLVLKAFHMPDRAQLLMEELTALWEAYCPHMEWESEPELERRVLQLLPALMLARIDGKSPVEYLDADTRERVRECAIRLLVKPPFTVAEFTQKIRTTCG